MKIGNIEITKEKFIIAIAALVLAITLLVYIIFYAPLMKRLRAAYLECCALENEVTYACHVIDVVGKTYGDRVLMTERDVSGAIDELTKHGNSIGIEFHSIKPKEILKEKMQYKILPIEMRIEATDEQFSRFLGYLDELKKSVIKVKSFDVLPNMKDRTRLKADIVIDLYLSPKEEHLFN